MTRDEAAALLGVRRHAGPDDVRRAWRTWARLAHPDAGGDAEHFARLDEARRLLLRPVPAAFAAQGAGPTPGPRLPWSAVLRRPRRVLALVALVIAAVATGALPAVLGVGLPSVASAALLAALAAVVVARSILGPDADPGHRIITLAAVWAPLALAQVALSTVLGASLLPVLPLLAVPLVAAVAAVNPGAGLWRPVMCTAWSKEWDKSDRI